MPRENEVVFPGEARSSEAGPPKRSKQDEVLASNQVKALNTAPTPSRIYAPAPAAPPSASVIAATQAKAVVPTPDSVIQEINAIFSTKQVFSAKNLTLVQSNKIQSKLRSLSFSDLVNFKSFLGYADPQAIWSHLTSWFA